MLQAEQLRSKAQRPEQSRQHTQLCRYLYYLGRIRAITLDYTDAKDCFQQAARKVRLSADVHLTGTSGDGSLHDKEICILFGSWQCGECRRCPR